MNNRAVIYLDAKLHAKIKKEAKKRGMTLQGLINVTVEEKLKQLKEEDK